MRNWKGWMGWGKVGGRKVYTLAYADDVAVMAEDEEGMKGMMARLERYMDEKGLQLNVGKSKIMRCRKEGGRWKKLVWRWNGREVEEVREFQYLGYTIMANGGQEAHVRDRVRKAAAVMGKAWGIGKRKFGKDWGKRVWLFDRLVWATWDMGWRYGDGGRGRGWSVCRRGM